jgi:putative SOS response-associated peptidase YedK
MRDLAESFGVLRIEDVPARFNIAPSQAIPVVRQTDQGRKLEFLRWGLIPHWVRTINARAETVATKPAFRAAFRHRRCLIPRTAFTSGKGETKPKRPFYIKRSDGRPFGFAGL